MVNAGSSAEVSIDERLVRALLSSQCPVLDGVDVSSLSLVPFANGWDNDIWSLGEQWLVRLPRRAAAASLVENEQNWLPVLAPRLSLPVPVPVFAGSASFAGSESAGFPWRWSVVPRFAGDVAARSVLADPEREAVRLAEFLRELHVSAPVDAPRNPFRGLPVSEIEGKYAIRRERQHERLILEGRDIAVLDRIMEIGLHAPVHAGEPVWVHGDMHIGNVLVSGGALAGGSVSGRSESEEAVSAGEVSADVETGGAISAVIDWGDVCSGDPACDLQIAWMMFDADARDAFFGAYGEGFAGLAERSRAWAVHSALVYLDNDDGDPLMTLMANTVLDRLLAD